MIFPVGTGMEMISCNSAEPGEYICEQLLKSCLSPHPAPSHQVVTIVPWMMCASVTSQLAWVSSLTCHLGKVQDRLGGSWAPKALSSCALCPQKEPCRDLEMDHTATSPGLTWSNGLWRENGKKAQCASKFAGGCWWKWGLWCTHWSTGSWTETKPFHAGHCTAQEDHSQSVLSTLSSFGMKNCIVCD